MDLNEVARFAVNEYSVQGQLGLEQGTRLIFVPA